MDRKLWMGCGEHLLSVSVRATRNRLKGGRSSRAFKIEKAIARMMYGATILNIYGVQKSA